jgi:three-Cys-motif partner protein
MDCLTRPFMLKVDLSNYEGREQAFVKHYLLERYLPDWAYKVGSKWGSLVYVDGFAGPWGSKDPNHADTSFGIAVNALRNSQAGLSSKQVNLSVGSILVEKDKDAFQELNAFAQANNQHGFLVKAIRGKFADCLNKVNAEISKVGVKPFKFVLLDPKGWVDIPMLTLRPFLTGRSCEVLVNLMTSDIIRFVNEDTRAESYRSLFGRPGILELLQQAEGIEKVDLAVKEYCRSLKQLCQFQHVSSAAILEPAKREIKYFLVYATQSPIGIAVFKDAEMKAAKIQELVREEKELQRTQQNPLFPDPEPMSSFTLGLRRRYLNLARRKVIEQLKDPERSRFAYENLFCEAMAFPLVTSDDLHQWLKDWEPFVEIHLSKETRRKPTLGKADYVVVKNRDKLE